MSIKPTELVKLVQDKQHEEEQLMSAIQNLVEIDLLRYKADRTVTYHSKLVFKCVASGRRRLDFTCLRQER